MLKLFFFLFSDPLRGEILIILTLLTAGAAECYHAVTRRHLSEACTAAAASSISTALSHINTALHVSPHFYCAWKLLGDVCSLAIEIPFEYLKLVTMPRDLFELLALGNVYNETDPLLRLATLAYTQASKFVPIALRAPILADIAASFVNRGLRLVERRQANASSLFLDAISAAKQGIRVNSVHPPLWNVLGISSLHAKARPPASIDNKPE
jgi:hypothetical protein